MTNDLIEFYLMGLLKAAKCLKEELKTYRMSDPNSIKEIMLWKQCEKRFTELDYYKNMLPEEIVELIITHANRS